MVYKWIRKVIAREVENYLSRLPDDKITTVAARVMSAQGLTESAYAKLIDATDKDKVVTLYFADGSRAIISSNEQTIARGPKW